MLGARKKFNDALEKGAEASEYLKSYTHHQIQLRKLELSKIIGKTTANITEAAVGGVIFSFALLFALIALALWIGNELESLPLGYLCVAALLLVIFGIFHLLKGVLIQRPAEKEASKKIFKNNPPTLTEAQLRQKIHHLETLLKESGKDIPAALEQVSSNDFLPDEVNRMRESKIVRIMQRILGSNKN